MENGVYCKMLPWDTDFFGFKIAQVSVHRLEEQKLTHMLDWCRKNKIDCVYFLADSEDGQSIRLVEDCGFRLVDIRMTFENNISNSNTSESNISNHAYHVRPHRQSDISALERIARDSYHDTRFYYDPCFSDDACRKLYATWIKRSCEGYADQVFIAEEKGVPIGYISCHLKHASSIGQIGLIGVDQQARGRKVGKILLLKSIEWFVEQEIKKIRVVTQGRNVAAQQFYERCGFFTYRVQIWYHKWFTSCEG